MKKIIKISVVLAIAMLISLMAVATVSATSDLKSEKTNTGFNIESKEKKVASFKITWNGNGGKFGSKKTKVTSIKKGSKIGKLIATPKRSGYTFKGYYTKKSGGKKVTKNTKVTKKVTFFAHWKKGITSTSSKLIGSWAHVGGGYSYYYIFNKNGSFKYLYFFGTSVSSTEGKYKTANGKIYFTNIIYDRGGSLEKRYKDMTCEYKFSKDNVGDYLLLPPGLEYSIYDTSYVDISKNVRFRK